MIPCVVVETARVYRVPGGRSRLTRRAAYREAARIRIRDACDCGGLEPGEQSDPCRFHGGTHRTGPAWEHRSIVVTAWEVDSDFDYEGELSRLYWALVRDRLARWLAWAER